MSRPKPKHARQKVAPKAAPTAPRSREISMRRLFPVLMTGLFLIAIFLLPYYVPCPGPSSSQSWEFGYNNTVAQALIALLLLSLFAWQLYFGRLKLDRDLIARTLLPDDEPVSQRALLYTLGIMILLTWAVLITWYNILPYTHYGEFTYFTQRVEAAVLGRKPFTDFAFDYGPGMLTVPVGIYRLFHGTVSVEASYASALIIHFTVGLALFAYVLSQINARGKSVIMAMIGFEWIGLSMGLQYTPLRFALAPASLFAVRHIHRVTRNFPVRRAVLLALTGYLTPLLTFSISPEMGFALTVGLCVYFLWFLFGPERRLALLVLSVLASGATASVVFPYTYFHSLFAFGQGAASFPLLPTIHILLFLAASIWVYPRLGIIAVRDRSSNGPFCAGITFFSGLLILPATGRIDAGHVWINSLTIFIIALGAASWFRAIWWYTSWGVYCVIFPVFTQVAFWDHYNEQVENVLAVRRELSSISYDADNYAHLQPGSPLPPIHYSKLLPMGGWLDALPKVKIGLPVGDNEQLERYLILNRRDIPEYFIPPFSDLDSTADLEREYKELRSMEYIYVPMYYLNYLRPVNTAVQDAAQAEADCKFLSGLLLFPVNLTPVHSLWQINVPIMRHIADEYGLVQQYPEGVLLKRKDAPPAP